jgi:chromosomal replication initiation ATPase DnaA
MKRALKLLKSLVDLFKSNKSAQSVKWQLIMQEVSKATGVIPSEILGECRKREITEARHLTMFLIAFYYPWLSHGQIAKLLNKKRLAVRSSVRKVEDLMHVDRSFAKKVAMITLKIKIERVVI